MIFQVPLGIAADALGVHLVLTGMIVVWSVGLGMHAWTTTVTGLWYARGLLGAGQSAVFAALNRISRDWFAPAVRTTQQGFVAVTAGRIGGLSANLLFGSLLLGMLNLPWRQAVYLFVGLGLAQAAAFYLVFRNRPGQHPRVNDAEVRLIGGEEAMVARSAPPRMTIGQLLRSVSPRGLLNLLALNLQAIPAFADNIYSNWILLFLYEASPATSIAAPTALPLMGAPRLASWRILNDWFMRKPATVAGRAARSEIAQRMASLLLFAALFWYNQPYVFCIFLFLVKLFGDWSLPTAWGVVTDIGGRATASVFALNNAVAGVALVAAPAAFGFLALHFGWYYVFVTVAVIYALNALSWLAIDATIPLFDETRKTTPLQSDD